jgi:hypothetical protein
MDKFLEKLNITFRIVKLGDIAYIFGIWGIAGFFLAREMDKLFPKFDEKVYDKKAYLEILMEIWINLSVLGIVSYIARNIIELLPSPFDGLAGFKHLRLKELSSAMPFMFFIMMFQLGLRQKILYITQNRKLYN